MFESHEMIVWGMSRQGKNETHLVYRMNCFSRRCDVIADDNMPNLAECAGIKIAGEPKAPSSKILTFHTCTTVPSPS